MAATLIGSSDGGKRPLSVAVNANGKAHVLYRNRDGKIHYRRWNGTEWEPDQPLPAPGAQNYHPQIVAPKGGAQAVFVSRLGDSASSYAIYHTARRAKEWGEPVRVSGEAYAQWPRLAVDADGILHVIYMTFGPKINQVYYARNDGSGWSKPQSLGAGFYPDLALDAHGAAHVVWDNSNGIFYTRQGKNGVWSKPVTLASGKRQQTAALAFDAMGNLHVTWQARDRDNLVLTYARVGANGETKIAEKVQGGALKLIYYPDVGVDSLNRPVLVYQGKFTTSGGEPWKVFQRVFDANAWSGLKRLDAPEMAASNQTPEIFCGGNVLVSSWWNSTTMEIYADIVTLPSGGTLSMAASAPTKGQARAASKKKTAARRKPTPKRNLSKRKTDKPAQRKPGAKRKSA